MNKCEHNEEIFIKVTGDKVYTGCKLCRQEYERYRALERLMEKYPNNYQFCSNEDCNNIFSRYYDTCVRCGAAPEDLGCVL
jgi:hypothetical protein